MDRKIFLLQPWYMDRCRVIPFSLLYIKYYLKDHGYDAKVMDASHYDEHYDHVVRMIRQEGDERAVIGVTGYSKERFKAYELIRRIKKEFPRATLVAGGRHFGYLPRETLASLPEVDIVVSGEGEATMKEICDVIHRGGSFKDILGLSYRENGDIVQNPARPLENDLDRFRMFEPGDIPEGYPLTLPTKMDPDPHFVIFATRGCPFKCTFCSLTATRPRYRSVDKVIEEIEQKIALTGARNVRFGDSSLTLDRKWMRRFCEKVIEKNLRIKWACYSRVDIPLEELELMRRAGLSSTEVALESGSERVLRAIKKSIDLKEFEDYCRKAHRLGIKIWVFTIISSPEERLEDVDMTIALIRKMSDFIYAAGMQVTRILPDATLIQEARLKGILSADFDWFKPYSNRGSGIARDDFDTLPIYIEHLTIDEINGKIEEFNRIIDGKFSSFYYLRRALFYQLKPRNLRKIFTDPDKIRRIVTRGTQQLIAAFKNINREKHYESAEGF